MLVRLAAEFQIEIPRGAERESRGALHMKIWRGWLMQLRLLIVDFFERHQRPTRLEKYVAVREFRCTVENMLEVQPGVGRDKRVACATAVSQFPDPIIAGTVNLMLELSPITALISPTVNFECAMHLLCHSNFPQPREILSLRF